MQLDPLEFPVKFQSKYINRNIFSKKIVFENVVHYVDCFRPQCVNTYNSTGLKEAWRRNQEILKTCLTHLGPGTNLIAFCHFDSILLRSITTVIILPIFVFVYKFIDEDNEKPVLVNLRA